ncbi:hypothetical protein [Pseudonocardia acidicola]|nr:hypothetical protein [Pseudonocardia acidicola]
MVRDDAVVAIRPPAGRAVPRNETVLAGRDQGAAARFLDPGLA